MLKFTVSKDSFLNKDNKVQVLSSTKNEMLGIYGDTKLLFLCECDSIGDFNVGMQLLGRNDLTIIQDDLSHTGTTYTFTETLTVSGVNSDEVTIAMLVDKYVPLIITSIGLLSITGVNYVYLYFQNSHYFPNPEYTYRDSTNPPSDNLYLRYGTDDENYLKIGYGMYEYITATTLRVKAEDIPLDVLEQLFGDYSKVSSTNPIDGNLDDIEIYRDTFLYDYDEENDYFSYSLYFDRPIQVLQFPISQTFSGNLLHEMAVQQDFVDVKKAEAINGIIDMEKDVYYPVIATANGGYNPAYKLIFNLHFRQHRGDDWAVSNDDYWNGTYNGIRTATSGEKKGEFESIELMDKSSASYNGYFSYMETDENYPLHDESYQSDLLTYLDFSNEDVYYQKNKIKKSFLRLSFYDSTNAANQNLLYYSTILMDTTKLFSRYSKQFESTSYSLLDYDSGETKLNLSGIRVGREPYGDRVSEAIADDDDIETVRLSSQLVVQDKYNASSSSEGFYLYIWRDNENPLPQDLYMKAEFNHAGHGRSLPMMVPYWDDGETKGFKTFEEIVDDWNIVNKDGTINGEEDDDGETVYKDVGYGIQQYLRYSYVHFKYRYDIESQQHIYYLDDELYGTDNMSNVLDNTIILNLYEAKIGAQSADDEDAVTYCYDCGNMTVTLSYENIPGDGGTVTPTVTYALDVYECDAEGNINTEAYVRTLTEKNSKATITYESIGECLCKEENGECICKATLNETTGAVTLNDANDGQEKVVRMVFEKVQVTVSLNNCSQSVKTSVYQDVAAEKTYTYSNLAIALSYDKIPPEGGSVEPNVEYSYIQTDSEGNSEPMSGTDPTVDYVTFYGSYGVVNENKGTVTAENNDTAGSRIIDKVTATIALGNQEAHSETVDVEQDYADIIYEDVIIESLTYSNIICDGGSTFPILKYSQHWYSQDGEDGYITDGATVEYSFDVNGAVDANQKLVDNESGEISAIGIESNEEQLLGTVTVKVSSHGKETEASQDVYMDSCEEEGDVEDYFIFGPSSGTGGVLADGTSTDPYGGQTFTVYSDSQTLRAGYKLTLTPTSNSFTVCVYEGEARDTKNDASWCDVTMYLYDKDEPIAYIGSGRFYGNGIDYETTCTECEVNGVEIEASDEDRKIRIGCTPTAINLRWYASVYIGGTNLTFDAILTKV